MTRPQRVTVVIPAYNAGHFIDDCLASVAAQTHPAHEVVVVDDGSTDDTAERIRLWEGRLGPARMVTFTGVRRGLSASRNIAMMAGTGDLFALLDSDDCFEPWHLERLVPAFEADPQLAMVFGDMMRFEAEGRDLGPILLRLHEQLRRISTPIEGTAVQRLSSELRRIYLEISAIAPSSCIVTREAVVRAGLFDPKARYGEDLDFLWRILSTGPGAWHDGITGRKREHGNNISNPMFAEQTEPQLLRTVVRLRSFSDDLSAEEVKALDEHIRYTARVSGWLAARGGLGSYLEWRWQIREWTGRAAPFRLKQFLLAVLRRGR